MEGTFGKALGVLERYVSPPIARALLTRALQEQGLIPELLSPRDLRQCSVALRRGISLFVDPSRRAPALRDINRLCGSNSLHPTGSTIEVRAEVDVGSVRAEARRICTACSADPFAMQKVATIVSELARNMVLYANGGLVEILPVTAEPKHILVRATDQGPGIPNLEEVFSGRYKSKTGLGRGILGTKRLADRFDISTGAAGTRITAEVLI